MGSHYLLMLLFAIFCLLSSYISPSFCADSSIKSLVTDKVALLSIKSRIIMEPPTALSTWDHSSSPCNWTRVMCNKLGQRVVGLDLSGLGITGSLSPHIGNLSFLRSLQLQRNGFTGVLPNEIGNLFRLRVLNMSFNRIDGAITPNIGQCIELRIIDLMQNEISGGIPEELSRLRKLEVLNLGRNNLSGAIMPSIGNISSLLVLNLGTNALGGMIPSDLGRLQNLHQLDLTINNLTGTVPSSIYNMSSLVSLALASNFLWGDLPFNVGITLPNLLVFNFCFNKFTGTIPGSLHNLTNIKIIRMANNSLGGTVPSGLGNLPDLQMYNIGSNNIVSSGDDGLGFLTSLTNSTRLNFLAVDDNFLEGVIPESIGNLSKVLTKLYMGGNLIRGTIPPSIGRISGLALLNLSYNSISGGIPPEIGQLEELQMLGLAGNHLSGKIPNSLGNLQKLNKIDVSRNELVGSIPTTFDNFHNLLSMDLSRNKVSGSIPKEILNLPSLSIFLNLSHNFLSGALPQEIGLLEKVASIDLSDNGFSGNIPVSIGNCKSLETLSIARNKFEGPIPNTLGALKGLETIDLSFNNLEGEVPSGGVFGNLSNVHLEGNPKLCLHLACATSRAHGRRLLKILVIAMVVSMLAISFVIGLLLYTRKGKAKVTEESKKSIKGEHEMVTYDELRRATANFSIENLIGQGGFGSVYKGYLREGIEIAVKVLDLEATGSWKSFAAECAALKQVRHRNLVKLITSCSSLNFKNMEFLALVYEFVSNGSLDDWIKGKRSNVLSVLDRLNVAIDVGCALNYLHHECETPVVHCDLKPSNVLLDEDMTAKVGDFGLARLLIESIGDQPSISSTNALKGSIGYIPPEYGMGGKPSTAGDVYSYGVMLLELFTGKSPNHESFAGELSLKKWVQTYFPADTEKILDPQLLDMGNSCHDGEYNSSPQMQLDCLITVMGVALSCTADSPDGRMTVRDALRKLKSVRDSLLKPQLTIKVNH